MLRSHERRGVLAIMGATLGMASGFGLLILSSVFTGPLVAEFGWTRTEVSSGYVLAALGMATGGMVWGRVSDRTDPRLLLAMGGMCQVLPLAWLASASDIWQFFGAHLVIGFFGFGAVYAPYVAVAGDWFPARRGVVMGIVTAGGAVGQGTLPYAAETLISHMGWRQSYLVLTVAMAAVQLLVYLTARRSTQAKQTHAGGMEVGSLFTPRLMLLGAAAFFCCACMGMPLFHLAGFVSLICGSSKLGATSLLVAMSSGAIGRISFGYLADRIGNYRTYRVAAAGQAASLVFFPAMTEIESLIVLSAVFGFAFSGNMTCMLLCIRQEVHPSRAGTATGGILFVAWAGMAAGGYLGGAVFDATRSFSSAFEIAAACGLAAFACLTVLDLRRSSTGGHASAPAPSGGAKSLTAPSTTEGKLSHLTR
jgi:MFS family permease